MLKNFVIAFVVSATMIGTSWPFWQEPAPVRLSSNPGLEGRSAEYASILVPSPTVTLLSTREVRTDLKLEADKSQKIDAISAELTRERARLTAEHNAKLSELNKKSADEALALLSNAQRQRIEQLRLQRQGLRALNSNPVVEKLGLSPEQRAEIAKLARSVPSFGRDPGTTVPPPSQTTPLADRIQQIIEEANKRAEETREKILALLTPEQKAKWFEMTDESFKLPTPQRSATRGTNIRSSEPAKPGAEKKDQ